MAVFGAPKEKIEELGDSEVEQYEILEENWDTVQIFIRLATQWNYSQGCRLGLNYQSVEFFFRLFKIQKRKEVFEELQVMEFAALKVFHERKKDGSGK